MEFKVGEVVISICDNSVYYASAYTHFPVLLTEKTKRGFYFTPLTENKHKGERPHGNPEHFVPLGNNKLIGILYGVER